MDAFEGAPAEVVHSFLQYMEDRITLLPRLWSEGHKFESLLLCCVYIEGLARWWYSPRNELPSKQLFFKIVDELSSPGPLSLIDPVLLARELESMEDRKKPHNRRNTALIKAIRSKFNPETSSLLTVPELVEALREALTPAQQAKLERNAWRGSIATAVYQHLRSPAVHQFSSPGAVVLPGARAEEGSYREVGFGELYSSLRSIARQIRQFLEERYLRS